VNDTGTPDVRSGGGVADAADAKENAGVVAKCKIGIAYKGAEKIAVLDVFYDAEEHDEETLEKIANCVDFDRVEREVLTAASEEAARAGVEVAYWEFVHRKFYDDGIMDFYEGVIENEDETEEGELCFFKVEVE